VVVGAFAFRDGLTSLIGAGADGPSAAVIAADLDRTLPTGSGHDGQQFYAIAREPMHLDSAAESLGRPRYRLQRIALPVAAWALQPTGGGSGLAIAMVAVGVGSMFAGGLAFGALVVSRGGAAISAGLFPLLPGSLLTLSIGAADTLALAGGLGAIVLATRRRLGWGAAAACVGVLAKESTILLLAAWMLAEAMTRTGGWQRRAAAILGVPMIAAGAWWVFLRVRFPASEGLVEFDRPFMGWWDSAQWAWRHGQDLAAPLWIVVAAVLAVVAIRRLGVLDPVAFVVLTQMAFLTVLSAPVIGIDDNAARTTAAAVTFGLVAVLAPWPHRSRPILPVG
jgi:hypothetical protein